MKRKLRHYAILYGGNGVARAVRWSKGSAVYRAAAGMGEWWRVFRGTTTGRTEAEALSRYAMAGKP